MALYDRFRGKFLYICKFSGTTIKVNLSRFRFMSFLHMVIIRNGQLLFAEVQVKF